MIKKLKKPAALLSVTALLFSSVLSMNVSGEATVTTYLRGDMDRNGKVNIADLILHKSYVLSDKKDSDPLSEKIADVGESGSAGWEDSVYLSDYLLDKDPSVYQINEFDVTDYPLIPSSLTGTVSCAQTTGEVRSLNFLVEFNNAKFSNSKKMSEEELSAELFGEGKAKYPYESVTAFIERASYGNLTMSGDVFYCSLNADIDYYSENGSTREKMMRDVLKAMDERIDYRDYDGDGDGDIDVLTFTLPLENLSSDLKTFWYAATHTWTHDPYFTVDGVKVVKYAGMDTTPYRDNMYVFKRDYTHEFGHCMGLQDYYKYQSQDSAGLKGAAGNCKMDDSMGDYCTFSKLMAGWLREDEVEVYDLNRGGEQIFYISDPALEGSCLILPAGSWNGNYTSEYFLVEYQSCEGNNRDVMNYLNGWYRKENNTGIRILHVDAEMTVDYWRQKQFKYNNYSDFYNGDDRQRILRLVNDPDHGYLKPGETQTGLKAYDQDGFETIDTGYEVKYTGFENGKACLHVTKK